MSQTALGTSIYAGITGNATLATLVSTRVYPVNATPPEPTKPYITYRRISQTRNNGANGAMADHAAARVQMDIYAATQAEVDAICDALRALCITNNFSGGLRRLAWDGGPVDMPEYDDVADQASPHVSIDLLATYKEL